MVLLYVAFAAKTYKDSLLEGRFLMDFSGPMQDQYNADAVVIRVYPW